MNATVAPNGGGYAYKNKDETPQQRGQWGANGTCVTKKVEASGHWVAGWRKSPEDGSWRLAALSVANAPPPTAGK